MYHLVLNKEVEKVPDKPVVEIIAELSATDPKTVASCLRVIADELDPPKKAQHFAHPIPGMRGTS